MKTRQQIRAAKQQLKKDNLKHPNILTKVNESIWPVRYKNIISVFRSKTFFVQVFKEQNATRLSICRTSIDNNGHWKADIKWEEIQEIKRQIGFGDRLAVEIYPKDKDIINVANMRHLWVLDYDLDFGWKK